ncbi:MAG: amidohydrolase family protein [Deltaproteobacteria bacterium]|nr:amidohydrolase family protein [Deltaproteobacteria bacterium]
MIIDFHTHIFPRFFRDSKEDYFAGESAFRLLYESPKSRLAGREQLLKSMDAEGVHRSVIFGFPWTHSDHFRRHNDYILETVEKYPDRFTGFCCFDPLSPEAPAEAERCLKEGLSGIGELALYSEGLSKSHIAGLKHIMILAREHDVPVMLHTNEPVGHQYPGKTPMTLKQIYDFLQAYPLNRIVLAHWGGGIFFYALMKKEVREVLQDVWFDTAASPFLYAPEIYRTVGTILGYEKILFGTDYPLLAPGRYFQEMEGVGLSSEDMTAITGGNAASLLGLST